MDTQKGETRALSDDQLDAVSGGDKATEREDKKQSDALKAFQQMLQELP
jgi:hypothetical protein